MSKLAERSFPFFTVLRGFGSFQWRPKKQKAFNELKEYIQQLPALSSLERSQPVIQQQQISLMYEAQPQPPLLQGAIDNKCPLANSLQLAPWPPQYRAAPPPKYFGDSDPSKFLMCYEVAIASSVSDEATLAKSFIISLECAIANWYARLQPRSIQSWHHPKEKILVNFQGFQAELNTKEDCLSCAQDEKESLPDFCRKFLRLKAQASEVSDEQVLTQAIKALHVGQLHNHLTRERPRMFEELYDNFQKFSKLEVLHFRKLEQ
jgi:hypothetical protein